MDPLFQTAKQGDLETVRALIVAGADVNKAENDGCTPLFIAAECGHLKIVQAL